MERTAGERQGIPARTVVPSVSIRDGTRQAPSYALAAVGTGLGPAGATTDLAP